MLFIINSLPSKTSIARGIKSSKTNQSQKQINSQESLNSNNLKAEAGANQTTPTDEKPTIEKTAEQKAKDDEMLRVFLTESFDDIRICQNLGKTEYFNIKKSGKQQDMSQLFADTERSDTFYEAFRIPIKAIFQDEQTSSLLTEILNIEEKNLEKEERHDLFEKLGFYSRVAMTAAHLVSKKSDFEYIGDRAMNLAAITKMAALKPELADDIELQNLCNEIENSVKDKKVIDIKKERQKITSLMKKFNIKNDDIDFDPESFIKFNIKADKKGFSFSLSDKDSK
jgi:hypothetical protein